MEGNLNMLPGGGSYGEGGSSVDLQLHESMRFNHHQHKNQQLQQQHQRDRQGSMLHPSIHDVFPPPSMGRMQEQGCCRSVSLGDYNETARGRNVVVSDDDNDVEEDERSLMDDVGNCGGRGGKGGSVWHRVKWTDQMVKLLITAVSYVGQDASSGYGGGGGRMKSVLMHKKGKWKSISKVMAERGFYVSPQQCEDKFNDLNKRYKRLNYILGRGTSCQVVEKPELLDLMDHISEKSKEDVRKILSSKQLFYEEMCSYHNGNRLHLPHDPALQRALHLAIESSNQRKSTDDYDEDNRGRESDEGDDFGECHTTHGPVTCGVIMGSSAKRTKQDLSGEDFSFGNAHEVCKISQTNPQNVHIDMNQACIESSKSAWYQGQKMQSCSLNLEERRIKIRMEMLELEKQRLKWQKFSQKKDRELEKMRLENESLRLENESMALELKQKELSLKGD